MPTAAPALHRNSFPRRRVSTKSGEPHFPFRAAGRHACLRTREERPRPASSAPSPSVLPVPSKGCRRRSSGGRARFRCRRPAAVRPTTEGWRPGIGPGRPVAARPRSRKDRMGIPRLAARIGDPTRGTGRSHRTDGARRRRPMTQLRYGFPPSVRLPVRFPARAAAASGPAGSVPSSRGSASSQRAIVGGEYSPRSDSRS